MEYIIYNGELYHYGLKGMKWGTRRWQNSDGTFNSAGKARYFGQNSTHRPDSVRALQGDAPKVAKSSSARALEQKSFDRQRAKKIAKNVAIGAAIVGGAVLVTYGGYKVHQAGGFSAISNNLKTKMRETKLDNLRTKQEYKAEMASIKSQGKQNLERIKENTKNEFARIHEEGRLERKMIRLDPEGKLNRGVAKELAGRPDQKIIKNRLGLLDADEITALNSGKVKLSDLQGRKGRDFDPHQNIGKSIMDASRHSSRFNNEYDSWLKDLAQGKASRSDRPIPDASYLTDNPVTKNWWHNRHAISGDKAVSTAKKIGSTITKAATSDNTKKVIGTVKNAGSSAVKAATSDSAKKIYRNIGNAAKTAGSSVVKAAKSKEAKDVASAAVKLGKETGKAVSKAAKSTAQIVSEYRKEHPNTRMSPQQIVNSVNGKSTSKSYSSKLTLTPEHLTAGAQLVSELNETLRTMKEINDQNSEAIRRGSKAVDDYNDQVLNQNRRKK